MIWVMKETILKKTTTICRLLVLSNQEASNSELMEGVNFWTNKYARATIRSLQASRRLPPNSWLGVGLKMAWQLVTLKHFGPDNHYGPCDSGSLVHWWGAINPLFSADNGRRYIFYHQYCFHLCDNDSCIPRRQTGYNPSIWIPGNNICIDKGMIPFREKVHFKVHKPDEYKIWL